MSNRQGSVLWSVIVGSLIACSSEKDNTVVLTPKRSLPSSVSPQMDKLAKEDSASPALKRGWHGFELGASSRNIAAQAEAIGFFYELPNVKWTPCQKKTAADLAGITLYDYVDHSFTEQKGIPLTDCAVDSPAVRAERLRNMEVVVRDKQFKAISNSGVKEVQLKYVHDKLYQIDLTFFENESFVGIEKNMTDSFGPPRWKGPISVKLCCTPTGPKRNSYEGREWSNNDTVIFAYTFALADGTTVSHVTYLNYAMLPEIKPLQDEAIKAALAPVPSQKSTATF